MSYQDVIYGNIILPLELQQLIAHPAVQRLGRIAQLGISSLITPTLRHTRLEHSIGVAYLALLTAQKLQLTPRQQLLLSIAGLLHDIGHGPFSHSFEQVISTRHEVRSQQIARLVLHAYPIDQVNTVCYLIHPHGFPPTPDAGVLKDLIANQTCAVDLDKIDYLLRDSYYASQSFCSLGEILSLIDRSRLVEGTWTFHPSDSEIIRRIFEHRQYMFHTIYRNPVLSNIETQLIMLIRRLNINWSILDIFLSYDDASLLNMITAAGYSPVNITPGASETYMDTQIPSEILPRVPYL